MSTDRHRGFTIGFPIDTNGKRLEDAVWVPPAHQSKHMALLGSSGAGKSGLMLNGITDNYAATAGADIILDHKGDGFPREYLRVHYACYGTLENVYYFPAEELVPAISFLDLAPLTDADVSRRAALNRIAGQYTALTRKVLSQHKLENSTRAGPYTETLIKALFDSRHGGDTYPHTDLREAARQYKAEGTLPSVSEPWLEENIRDMETVPTDMRLSIGDAMTDRLGDVSACPQVDAILNHVRPDAGASAAPQFDLKSVLNEDAVIIVDMQGLNDDGRHSLAALLLGQIWRALKRRKQGDGPTPLVNLYVDEAGAFAESETLIDLLSQGRSFNVGLTLIAQFPGQLSTDSQTTDIGDELLNNASTIIAGQVAEDARFVSRLAGTQFTEGEVEQQLDRLENGQWLTVLPAGFGSSPPRMFVAESPSLPPGHSAGAYPLSESRLKSHFDNAFDQRMADLTETAALSVTGTAQAEHTTTNKREPAIGVESSPAAVAFDRGNLLPVTKRLPFCVGYDLEAHRLHCTECDSTAMYRPTSDGLANAITCCHEFKSVDRANIPPIPCQPPCSLEAITDAGLSPTQALFMQAVHAAMHQRFSENGFRLRTDSMVRLKEYTDISSTAVEQLLERGLLTIDAKDSPHRVYSLTPDGREALSITLVEGRDYGEHIGDLGESALHRLAVLVGCEFIRAEYVADEDSPVEYVVPYYPVENAATTDAEPNDLRLDAAGLTEGGAIEVTLEAERINNDYKRAIPHDYEKMAACDPSAAIWVVMDRDGAHTVLDALNNPADDDPRVSKSYSEQTPPRQFNIAAPGLTDIRTVTSLLNSLDM